MSGHPDLILDPLVKLLQAAHYDCVCGDDDDDDDDDCDDDAVVMVARQLTMTIVRNSEVS